jgi:hypothetical protein
VADKYSKPVSQDTPCILAGIGIYHQTTMDDCRIAKMSRKLLDSSCLGRMQRKIFVIQRSELKRKSLGIFHCLHSDFRKARVSLRLVNEVAPGLAGVS